MTPLTKVSFIRCGRSRLYNEEWTAAELPRGTQPVYDTFNQGNLPKYQLYFEHIILKLLNHILTAVMVYFICLEKNRKLNVRVNDAWKFAILLRHFYYILKLPTTVAQR